LLTISLNTRSRRSDCGGDDLPLGPFDGPQHR
jgi:hypothetical protein